MSALDRKLLRDLLRIWAQALAIALVLACGVAVLVLAQGTSRTLTETRDAYYERHRFADIFADVTRAPAGLAERIAQIDGVAQVAPRIGAYVLSDMPGLAEPAMARLVSLPAVGAPPLNLPLVRLGRLPDPGRADEVALSENFALANDLLPGDRFMAILNGQRRSLQVTGHLMSPEFIYAMGPGTLIPDDRRFGIVWIGHDAAAAAFDMDGAFNHVALGLTPGARAEAVIDALDHILAPYGGTGAQTRARQISNAFLQSELDQLAAIAVVLPPVFFVVSAFLVNMVMGRLIALERAQIGLLKAVGYTRREVGWHYFKLAALIGLTGVVIGWGAGAWLAGQMAAIYAQFFSFPFLVYVPSPGAFVLSGVLGVGTVLLGAMRAVRAALALSPAEAMSPPAPPRYSRGLADRIAARVRLRQTSMMILRSLTRWPGRAAVTLFGVAASVSILVASFFTFDSMEMMVDQAFHQANRADMTLMLARAHPDEAALGAARALPGVLRAEGAFSVPVALHAGSREKLLRLEAQRSDATLVRILAQDGGAVQVPPAGLALPQSLADEFGLGLGDHVTVELLIPPRETHQLPVTAITAQALGQELFMDAGALFALMRQPPQVNRINLLIDPAALPDLHAAIKRTPAISGVMLWTETRRMFVDEIQRNLWTMVAIYSVLGMLVTVGVVYNAARIQLSERAHELASLRVLGFSRAEVGFVLVGELMLLALLAIPLGWVLGYGFASMTAAGLSTEIVTIPLVVTRATYGAASAIVLVAALGSVLVVKRRLDRIELVAALKAKE